MQKDSIRNATRKSLGNGACCLQYKFKCSWLLLSDKTVIVSIVGEQKLQSEAEYIFEILGSYIFYFITCFPFILILRDLFFFC